MTDIKTEVAVNGSEIVPFAKVAVGDFYAHLDGVICRKVSSENYIVVVDPEGFNDTCSLCPFCSSESPSQLVQLVKKVEFTL